MKYRQIEPRYTPLGNGEPLYPADPEVRPSQPEKREAYPEEWGKETHEPYPEDRDRDMRHPEDR